MNDPITKILRPVKRSIGGQHVPHSKNTAEMQSVIMPAPEKVVIPTLMHIGAPCTVSVNKGDHVFVGQCIADSDSPVAAPIHASVSGTVENISDIDIAGGRTMPAITIISDGLMEKDPSITPPDVCNIDQFIAAVRASGLVGLGGAGFPASVKLRPSGKSIDTLVINAAECEPYITADYRECTESYQSLFDGVYLLQKYLNIDRTVICVENNKPKAIKQLAEIAAADDKIGDKVKLMELPAKYPQGAEKVIVYSATGRAVPAGGLPADVGCIVMNVTSVSFLGKYFETGMPLVSKRITVDGDAVKNPQNLIVPIGTRAKDVLDFCGIKEQYSKLLMGGPMMGIAMYSDEMPVQKQTNALLAFTKKLAEPPAASACIHCGRCVSACPMGLMPLAVEQALAAKDDSRLDRLSVMTCMECGCCSFGCPAKRPLVQSMRLAKQKIRERK